MTGDPAFSMYNLCLMDEYRQNGAAGGSRSEGALDTRRRIKSENGTSGSNGVETGNDANPVTASQSRIRHFSDKPMSVSSSTSLDEDEEYDDDGAAVVEDHRRDNSSLDSVSLLLPSRSDAEKNILQSIENRVSKDGVFFTPTEPFHPSEALNGVDSAPYPPAAPFSSPSGVAKRLLARSMQRSASLPPNADFTRNGRENGKLNGSSIQQDKE